MTAGASRPRSSAWRSTTVLAVVLVVAVVSSLSAGAGVSAAAVGGGGETGITTTTSTTRATTYTDHVLPSQHVDAFQTRVTARFGTLLVYDQTIDAAFGSAPAQAAVSQAAQALDAASAGASIAGPAALSSQITTTTATGIQEHLDHTEISVTTTTTIGPATILIGEDQSETYFVAAGTVNINTNTHTQFFVDRTTQETETTLTAAHYELVGSGGAGLSCAPPGGATVAIAPSPRPQTPGAAAPVPLLAALLPGSRSVKIGCPATAFVTVINAGAETATGVGIALADPALAVALIYQTTDPLTNALVGTANTPADIAPGQARTFLVALTPLGPLAPREVFFTFTGANAAGVAPVVGLNTLLLAGAMPPTPDIVALAATASNDGIVEIDGPTGAGAFAVASVNVGVGGSVTVSADTGGVPLPLSLSLCRTNAAGACLAPPSSDVTLPIDPGATPTFAVFAQGTGTVAFDPAAHRVFVRFKDAGGATRGSTSVAPRTR